MNESVPHYWDHAASPDQSGVAVPLWRRYCDALHARLIVEWTAGRRYERALKTDLFDEAVGEGLVSCLAGISTTVHGIDVAERIVALAARRQPRLVARRSDVRHLDGMDASFDLIVSNSTLDHFDDPADLTRAIGALARALRPGGDLLVTLDNPGNIMVALRNRLPAAVVGRSSLVPYFTGHTLALRPLTEALAREGLEIRRTGYIMHLPRVLFLHACRLFPGDGPLSRGFLRLMGSFEMFRALPSARVTGHYVVALARKPA